MKDPAFLFYSSDFLVGTIFMSFEQKGKYITLLCMQHQKGHLTKEQVATVCDDKDILSKFSLDKKGLLFNERLDKEVDKRASYTKNRLKNLASKGSKGVSHMGSHKVSHVAVHTGSHTENENEDTNEDTNEDAKANKNEEIHSEVIGYLNIILDTKFKATETCKGFINARVKEGATIEDFEKVIDKKHKDWKGTTMAKYLRPQTLFGTKFDSYLNEKDDEHVKSFFEMYEDDQREEKL